MTLEDLLRSVGKVELVSRQGSKQRYAGSYNSFFKGSGYSFDKVTKYQIGDDVRNMNWSVTARFREPYVNSYTEDKQQQIWILIDSSRSGTFSTGLKSKLDIEIELAGVIAYNALKNNDSVGLIFFSDKIEHVVYPVKGQSNFLYLANKLVSVKANGGSTDICGALKYLMKISRKNSMVFILSDFIADDYETSCKHLFQIHETVALRIFDPGEYELPKMGWMKMQDAETNSNRWINTSSVKFAGQLKDRYQKTENYFNNVFSQQRVSTTTISTFDNPAQKLFEFMNSKK